MSVLQGAKSAQCASMTILLVAIIVAMAGVSSGYDCKNLISFDYNNFSPASILVPFNSGAIDNSTAVYII